MIKMSREQATARGFIIDSTCYPNVAYKGPRFGPDEIYVILTETEEMYLGALADLLGTTDVNLDEQDPTTQESLDRIYGNKHLNKDLEQWNEIHR